MQKFIVLLGFNREEDDVLLWIFVKLKLPDRRFFQMTHPVVMRDTDFADAKRQRLICTAFPAVESSRF